MTNNLNTAKTQEEFNAKFILFVPIVLRKIEMINRIAV